jgi:hypothetical protein
MMVVQLVFAIRGLGFGTGSLPESDNVRSEFHGGRLARRWQ